MKEKFDQIESQLKRFIEESTARLFASMSVESQLAERLVEAMRSKTEVSSDGTLWAPSIYMIAVHPDFTVDMRSNHALLETLAQTLQEVGERADVHFRANPLLTIVPDAVDVSVVELVAADRRQDDHVERARRGRIVTLVDLRQRSAEPGAATRGRETGAPCR